MNELVNQLVDAVARQDADRLVELTDPEVEWHSVFAQLREGGVYRGHDGIRQYAKDLADTAELLRARIEDTLSVGDVILAVGELHFRGKESGVEMRTQLGYYVQVRDGRVLRLRIYRDPAEAFKVLA